MQNLVNASAMNQSILLSGDMPPKSHPFGQVVFPKKNDISWFFSPFSSSSSKSNTKQTISSLTPTTISTNESHNLASLWREMQGCNDWQGLVDPLHPVLRDEIVRYGEFVGACYKAFDLDPTSKRHLTCKYGKKNIFKEVGMENCGYEVTKYIYATPFSNIPIQESCASCGRWIGFVAISSDGEVHRLGRRDILVSFRGTVTIQEWVVNFMSSLTPARLDPTDPRPEVKVESGFLSLYTSDERSNKFGVESCRQQLLSEVSKLLNKYKEEEVSISLAGHSMGSSLALLLAYDICELGLNKTNPFRVVPVTVFSFGGPRVGNSEFKERCEELGAKVLRIVNVNDPITKLPGVFLNENVRVFGGGRYELPWRFSCYTHVGVELVLDFHNMENPICVHDIETYINLLKYPNSSQYIGKNIDTEQVEVLSRAKELMLNAKGKFNMLPFKNVATNMVVYFQFPSTELLSDYIMLSWMKWLALIILFFFLNVALIILPYLEFNPRY